MPLCGFDAAAAALRGDARSWIDVCPRGAPDRRPPPFPSGHFRKQSQWMVLNRAHAELIADDPLAATFFPAWCADEHDPISLLSLRGRLEEVADRPATYVDWTTHPGAAHPGAFPPTPGDADRQVIAAARDRGVPFARKFPPGVDWPFLDRRGPIRPRRAAVAVPPSIFRPTPRRLGRPSA